MAVTEKLGEAYEFTSPVQLYFARGLFVPTAIPSVANAEEKYNAWFILDRASPDFMPLVMMIRKVAAFKLAETKMAKTPYTPAEDKDIKLRMRQNDGFNHPLWSGDRVIANSTEKGKSVDNLAAAIGGKYVLSGRSGKEYPPRLGGYVNGQAKDFDGAMRDAQRGQFYNGVLVYPKVYLRLYELFGGGVSCRISSVFSTGEGDRLAGGEGISAIPSGIASSHTGVSTGADPYGEEFSAPSNQDDF